jgi:hypothetical protein
MCPDAIRRTPKPPWFLAPGNSVCSRRWCVRLPLLATARRFWFAEARWLLLLVAVGCRVPREVHEPLEYPKATLAASALTLRVSDPRPPPRGPEQRDLVLPDDFEPTARAHLARLGLSQGPHLVVNVSVTRAETRDLVDARGEMTRVSVDLGFEIGVNGGPTLRRADTHSESDLPRDEATPEEIALLLRTTALDAFDRYWANPATEHALNRDLAAYQARPQRLRAPEPGEAKTGI